MENVWNQFSKDDIIKKHGDVYMYRDLYKGRHAKHSPRASQLIKDGEVIDYLEKGRQEAINVRTPYITANISKVICDIPALLISSSIGEIVTNHKDIVTAIKGEEESIESGEDGDDEAGEGDTTPEVIDLQQSMIDQIIDNSKLTSKHRSNILMHQVDGGIVGVPLLIDGKPTIQFKDRTVYYPHPDGKGVDLIYELEQNDEDDNEYVLKYTERELRNSLQTTNQLFKRNEDSKLTPVTDEAEYRKVMGQNSYDMQRTFTGRHRTFIQYLGNNTSHMDPLGHSELEGQEGKQEEINWTITRTAITFERNGKPRISITPEIMQRLQEIAEERYGDRERIDHRDLEITTTNEDGRSIELHTIDITKIGDMTYIKDIIKIMLSETNTSQNATEFLQEKSGTASAQSGIAKFYDLFHSQLKAESIRVEYIDFISDLMEGVLWLVNHSINDRIIIEKPIINVTDMITKPKSEKDASIIERYEKGLISLETAIAELNPEKSEDWVLDEVLRIQDERASDDSFSYARGRQNLIGMFGNRDNAGNPLNEDGTPVNDPNDDSQAGTGSGE